MHGFPRNFRDKSIEIEGKHQLIQVKEVRAKQDLEELQIPDAVLTSSRSRPGRFRALHRLTSSVTCGIFTNALLLR